MALTYDHIPPGTPMRRRDITERLRAWDNSSPYHKNRPLRGPRGGDVLRLLYKPRTFRNVPELTGVTVHCFARGAIEDSGYLAVAGMVVQSITGARVRVHQSKKSVAPFGLKAKTYISVTSHLQGQLAWRFVANLVDVCMPRMKEYLGVKGSSGDSSGNITFGFTPEQVAIFPEIEGEHNGNGAVLAVD